MNNKQIREERVRNYFIESCKKIIRGEGVACVNVRNVADDAGYSSATLYNYFKDITELLNVCIIELIQEIKQTVENGQKAEEDEISSIRNKVRAYCNYFVQYPGIYELLFLEKRSVLGYNKEISEMTDGILKMAIQKDFDHIFDVSDKKVELLNIFNAMINGFLLMYINKRVPIEYVDFMQSINYSIENFFVQLAKK